MRLEYNNHSRWCHPQHYNSIKTSLVFSFYQHHPQPIVNMAIAKISKCSLYTHGRTTSKGAKNERRCRSTLGCVLLKTDAGWHRNVNVYIYSPDISRYNYFFKPSANLDFEESCRYFLELGVSLPHVHLSNKLTEKVLAVRFGAWHNVSPPLHCPTGTTRATLTELALIWHKASWTHYYRNRRPHLGNPSFLRL